MNKPSLAPVTSALNTLENTFSSALQQRQGIINRYDAMPADATNNILRDAALIQLANQTRTTAKASAATVGSKFDALIAAASEYAASVRRADSQSPEYAQYRQELNAMGVVLQYADESAACGWLESALNDGRQPQARALAELVSLKFGVGNRSFRTGFLLARAEEEVSVDEAAEDYQQAIAIAAGNWNAVSGTLDTRLSAVLEGVTTAGWNASTGAAITTISDMRAGCFSPAYIFGSAFLAENN